MQQKARCDCNLHGNMTCKYFRITALELQRSINQIHLKY